MEKNHIKAFRDSDAEKITQLYEGNRNAFIGFGKRYGLTDDDLADIYQEAFIALRKHAISGKLATVKSSLKTYLFGIGKFMIYNTLKEKKRTTTYESNIHTSHDTITSISYETDDLELTMEQHLLRAFFKKIGKNCQKLLTMFYSRGLSIDEIVEMTDYKQSSVVRSQKSRCVKSLRKLIKS